MQKELILVTFNYRLSVLGFISFEDPELGIPGNAGLKDQRLAMQWVKENVAGFGGDPTNITVFGHSAGSVSLHHHLMSAGSEGLFQRAIMMSGAALTPWGTSRAKNMAEKLALNLDWDGVGGERGAYKFLMAQDAGKMMKLSYRDFLLTKEDDLKDVFHPFGPIVETYSDEQTVVGKDPLLLARNCWGNKIDVILWMASNEALFAFDGMIQKDLLEDLDERLLIPYQIRQRMNQTDFKTSVRKIKSIYGNFKDFGPHNYQPMLDVSLKYLFKILRSIDKKKLINQILSSFVAISSSITARIGQFCLV